MGVVLKMYLMCVCMFLYTVQYVMLYIFNMDSETLISWYVECVEYSNPIVFGEGHPNLNLTNVVCIRLFP